jgi:hypothetical protein
MHGALAQETRDELTSITLATLPQPPELRVPTPPQGLPQCSQTTLKAQSSPKIGAPQLCREVSGGVSTQALQQIAYLTTPGSYVAALEAG